jgi:hypothetical protein
MRGVKGSTLKSVSSISIVFRLHTSGISLSMSPSNLGEVVGVVDHSDNNGFRNDVANDVSSFKPGGGERMGGYLAIAPPEYLRTPKRGMLCTSHTCLSR